MEWHVRESLARHERRLYRDLNRLTIIRRHLAKETPPEGQYLDEEEGVCNEPVSHHDDSDPLARFSPVLFIACNGRDREARPPARSRRGEGPLLELLHAPAQGTGIRNHQDQ